MNFTHKNFLKIVNDYIYVFSRKNLITINELMLGLKRLQKLDDETKFQKIIEVLDEDGDGAIDLEHAMKVSLYNFYEIYLLY